MKNHILVVDDDIDLCKMISEYLSDEFFHVEIATSAKQALNLIGKSKPDLILLDIRLPDMDGLNLLTDLKKQNLDVILLSGKTGVADKVSGLELGAEDYVTKPFHIRELLARIKLVLRRQESHSTAHIESVESIGNNWVIDQKSQNLSNDKGKNIHLTSHEYALLYFLLSNINQAVSRDEISQAVYDVAWSPSARRVDTLVYQLRQKLKIYPDLPEIRTVHTKGYVIYYKDENNGDLV